MFVADGGGAAGLAEEALAGGGAGDQPGPQHLDGHDPMQVVVEGLEDDAEAAAAEDFLDLVMSQSAERAGPLRGPQEGEDELLVIVRRLGPRDGLFKGAGPFAGAATIRPRGEAVSPAQARSRYALRSAGVAISRAWSKTARTFPGWFSTA